MPPLGIATKISIVLLLICLASVLCVFALPIFEPASGACKAIEDCDPFLPVCAAFSNEHQFFYSHCDMQRDICLTGKGKPETPETYSVSVKKLIKTYIILDWKADYLSHCNVSKL
ncbi:hypothetical protein KR093_007403 [Drosophila rubida]|uniref:Kazal-like domain-containing protein n=1 Tax=Drosophila rubida TaxID=30044 RepID=A0AAD4PJ89_9MUSC|nr:hypothetical protein KR093_007403 [Drosophila rubida]